MSRIRITLMMALVFALAAAAINSQAQPPAGGRGGGGGGGGGRGQRRRRPGRRAWRLRWPRRSRRQSHCAGGQRSRGKRAQADRPPEGEDQAACRRAEHEARRSHEPDAPADARRSAIRRPNKHKLARSSNPKLIPTSTLAAREPAMRLAGALERPRISTASLWRANPGRSGRPCRTTAGRSVPGTAGGQRRASPGLADDARGDAAAPESVRKRTGPYPRQDPDQAPQEIQLQVQGPSAVLREDVAERLELTEEQGVEIREVLNQANQTQRELMRTNFQFVRSLMPNQPAGGNAAAAGAQTDSNAATTPPRLAARMLKDRLAKAVVDVAAAEIAVAEPMGKITGVASIAKQCKKSWSSPR